MTTLIEAPRTRISADRQTLLIVDDEEGPRLSLRVVFARDYKVLVAEDARSALELARRETIHVAVLDIMMPGMSGVELLRELKGMNGQMEVLMLTAYETLDTARQALRYGAADYLTKPFDVPQMRAAVSRAASKAQESASLRRNDAEVEVLQKEITDQRVKEEMARTRGEIYASVLHDINSPLTVIAGFVELMAMTLSEVQCLEGASLESVRDDLRSIGGQVDRCFEISRRYLSFLNTSNRSQNHRCSLRQIMADVRDLLIRHPAAHSQELVVRDPPADVMAEINGTDLLQVLLNLTINALQATEEPHRVSIDANLLPEPLDLTKFTDGPTERFVGGEHFLNRAPLLAVSIRDTGPGIAPENVARMFVEHFSTKAPGKGTGLGLSIVKRLVREAHGAIHFQTAIGHGSEFTLLFQTC